MARSRRPSPQTVAVLHDLAQRGDGWSHGYDLSARLGISAGTLYPILIRLRERGQLEAMWEADPPQGRPPRHLYRLSPAGAEAARAIEPGTAASAAVRLARPRPVRATPSSRTSAPGWAIA